ncbi:putative capsular polysaccharide synthesis family protein [Thalassospira lucentensis]|uniref:putative capsular polysaccharide synthesis family protein n=1 Tax=Thalassospira lucentensis TaxID=168935 RepID=UPI0003B7B2B8|nr:putative capsular polysaccharide synthesis family protein [Thalassospira lucentensis]RCK18815.1 hypothetical protein TH1_22155 [Thalassospira lucentensis MCCC 1A00383 = DSM 14000]
MITIYSRDRYENLFKLNIVLYGAGITGVETYNILNNYFDGVHVEGFCDTYKSGRLIELDILTPDQLVEECASTPKVVIVTGLSHNALEILDSLTRSGIRREYIYTLEELDQLVLSNLQDVRINKWYRDIKAIKISLPKDTKRNLYQNWWCPEHYCDGDVLVYQPGKVGSSSVCNSLSYAGIPATHVHMLTEEFIFDLVPELAWVPTASQLEAIQLASRICNEKIRSSARLKIISLVREPISRDFSHFLYHVDELKRNNYFQASEPSLANCAEGILRRATQNGKCSSGYQFEWFTKELQKVFGVNVFEYPFNREAGYTIIKENNIELLLIKLEKLNELESVIGEFVDAPDFKIINTNEASNGKNKKLYLYFRQSVKVPEVVAEMYYGANKYFNHFYSLEEKKAFCRKWGVDAC